MFLKFQRVAGFRVLPNWIAELPLPDFCIPAFNWCSGTRKARGLVGPHPVPGGPLGADGAAFGGVGAELREAALSTKGRGAPGWGWAARSAPLPPDVGLPGPGGGPFVPGAVPSLPAARFRLPAALRGTLGFVSEMAFGGSYF